MHKRHCIFLHSDTYSGPPQLFLDSPNTMVATADTLNMTCYVGGVSENMSTLQLLREKVVISDATLEVVNYAKHKFSMSSASFGSYMCELLLDGNSSYFSSAVRITGTYWTCQIKGRLISLFTPRCYRRKLHSVFRR